MTLLRPFTRRAGLAFAIPLAVMLRISVIVITQIGRS